MEALKDKLLLRNRVQKTRLEEQVEQLTRDRNQYVKLWHKAVGETRSLHEQQATAGTAKAHADSVLQATQADLAEARQQTQEAASEVELLGLHLDNLVQQNSEQCDEMIADRQQLAEMRAIQPGWPALARIHQARTAADIALAEKHDDLIHARALLEKAQKELAETQQALLATQKELRRNSRASTGRALRAGPPLNQRVAKPKPAPEPARSAP